MKRTKKIIVVVLTLVMLGNALPTYANEINPENVISDDMNIEVEPGANDSEDTQVEAAANDSEDADDKTVDEVFTETNEEESKSHEQKNEETQSTDEESSDILESSKSDVDLLGEYGDGEEKQKIAYIKDVSLNIRGKIEINFYFDFSNLSEQSDIDNYYITINEYKDYLKAAIFETMDDIKFTYSVSAREMNKPISVTIYDGNNNIIELQNKDGKVYPDGTYTFSVRDYLEEAGANEDYPDTLQNLAYFMDVYGQKAQEYFGYDTESVTGDLNAKEVPNDILKQYKKAFRNTMPEGVEYRGSSLMLEDEITIRHYFYLTGDAGINNYKFNLYYPDDDAGNTMDMSKYDGPYEMEIKSKGSVYYVEIEDISPVEAKDTFVIEIKDKNNNSCFMGYSVLSYIYDAINSEKTSEKAKNLCKALYWFCISARDYFGIKDEYTGKVIEHEVHDDNIQPFSGNLKDEAYALITQVNATSIFGTCYKEYYEDTLAMYQRWRAFQNAVIQETSTSDTIVYDMDDNMELRICNTDGTNSGVYIYYGEDADDGTVGLTIGGIDCTEEKVTDENGTPYYVYNYIGESGEKNKARTGFIKINDEIVTIDLSTTEDKEDDHTYDHARKNEIYFFDSDKNFLGMRWLDQEKPCTYYYPGTAYIRIVMKYEKKDKDDEKINEPLTDGDLAYFQRHMTKNKRRANAKWARVCFDEDDEKTVYTHEQYDGSFDHDIPNGNGSYEVSKLNYDKAEQKGTIDVYKYEDSDSKNLVTDGLINCNCTIQRKCSDYVTYCVMDHYYKVQFNNGKVEKSGETVYEDGTIRRQCQGHQSNAEDYITLDTKALYKINGIYSASASKVNKQFVSGNRAAGDSAFDLLSEAYNLITSEEVNYDKWSIFISEARKYGITSYYGARYKGALVAQTKDGKHLIGIYSGYGSDDIYIYLGPQSQTGLKRHGEKGKWMTASSFYRTEKETGYRDSAQYYEISTVDWSNNCPNGNFTTETFLEVYTSSKHTKTHTTYSGTLKTDSRSENVNDGYALGLYDGEVSWTETNEVKYLYLNEENSFTDEYSYSASFEDGILKTNNVDSEGYALISSKEDEKVFDRITTQKIYGLNGFYHGKEISQSPIIEYLNDSEIGGESAEDTLNTIFATADNLVNTNTENWDAWNTLYSEARAYGITSSAPVITTRNNKYLGVYGAYDGKGYCIYYGSMNDGIKSGKGKWISATSYRSTDSTTTGRILEEYNGDWENDRPEGNFSDTYTLWITRNDKTNKVVRSYTGQVTDGAYNGLISWDVDSCILQGGDTTDHNVHSFRANFNLGFIQGYSADRSGYINVPSVYGAYTEDRILALQQFLVGGIKGTDKAYVSGNRAEYKKKS